VFDSGIGGLTVVKRLMQCLPSEDIVYLGDTGRVPYGSRSKDTIIRYAKQDAAFLSGFDIKAVVVACNTVCSVAYEELLGFMDIPFFEVVGAPAKTAAETTKNGRIGVIGTAATIRSNAYLQAINAIRPDLEVFSKACPLFVPLVENGITDANDIAALSIAERYLKELSDYKVDTLIMGCTHYPLLKSVIAKVMGQDVMLIDSGAETAKAVAKSLSESALLSDKKAKGAVKYFVTDSIDGFSALASGYLESELSGLVEQVTIE